MINNHNHCKPRERLIKIPKGHKEQPQERYQKEDGKIIN